MGVDIESVLSDIGVQIIRETGDELFAKCPMHLARTGKLDGSPSWSINARTFVHHCFSCGYSGSLNTLYLDLQGSVPDDLEWEISKSSVAVTMEKAQRIDAGKPDGPQISEWTLQNKYKPLPAKLCSRRYLTPEAAAHYEVKWDTETKCIVIPIRSPKGELRGYQYKQRGVMINHPDDVRKADTLFGLHQVPDLQRRVMIVESPLDVVRLHPLGIPAVSSFGASVSDDQVDLLAARFLSVVLGMDNDDPGRRANEYLSWALRKRGCITVPFDYTGLVDDEGVDAKDPGDVKSDKSLTDSWYRSITFGLGR